MTCLTYAIGQRLGRHALAIVQAGTYIHQTGMTLTSYIDLYENRRASVLEAYKNLTQRRFSYSPTVHATWEISCDQPNAPAKAFLQLCSFLHNTGIYEWIFESATRVSRDYIVQEEFKYIG